MVSSLDINILTAATSIKVPISIHDSLIISFLIMLQCMSNIQSPITSIQTRHNKWYQQQMHSCMQQYHNNTAQRAFECFNNGGCQWAFSTLSDKYYRIRKIINNSNNNAVNSCSAHLTPNKQQVIDNPTTGDRNDIIASLKTSSN